MSRSRKRSQKKILQKEGPYQDLLDIIGKVLPRLDPTTLASLFNLVVTELADFIKSKKFAGTIRLFERITEIVAQTPITPPPPILTPAISNTPNSPTAPEVQPTLSMDSLSARTFPGRANRLVSRIPDALFQLDVCDLPVDDTVRKKQEIFERANALRIHMRLCWKSFLDKFNIEYPPRFQLITLQSTYSLNLVSRSDYDSFFSSLNLLTLHSEGAEVLSAENQTHSTRDIIEFEVSELIDEGSLLMGSVSPEGDHNFRVKIMTRSPNADKQLLLRLQDHGITPSQVQFDVEQTWPLRGLI